MARLTFFSCFSVPCFFFFLASPRGGSTKRSFRLFCVVIVNGKRRDASGPSLPRRNARFHYPRPGLRSSTLPLHIVFPHVMQMQPRITTSTKDRESVLTAEIPGTWLRDTPLALYRQYSRWNTARTCGRQWSEKSNKTIFAIFAAYVLFEGSIAQLAEKSCPQEHSKEVAAPYILLGKKEPDEIIVNLQRMTPRNENWKHTHPFLIITSWSCLPENSSTFSSTDFNYLPSL